ncbi:MAG: zf-HC2 domain-containing protein [Candidatus Omnitrophica bacterium]|nr:zf-HC2 domain-containing protein [Candidatus Omnitrophota bacterium]
MNCKKAREAILTDYLDNEIDAGRKARLEEHMARCPGCKTFYLTAARANNELFSKTNRANPPEYVWRRIREAVLNEKRSGNNFAAGILGKLRSLLYVPKPALAIASILILLLAVGTFAKIKSNSAQEQFEYFTYLTGASASAANGDNGSFGTTIEKYFM